MKKVTIWDKGHVRMRYAEIRKRAKEHWRSVPNDTLMASANAAGIVVGGRGRSQVLAVVVQLVATTWAESTLADSSVGEDANYDVTRLPSP